MKDFLRKIHLIDSLTVELDIKKSDFVHILQSNVDEGSIGLFSGPFEMFSGSKNEYIGHVDENGFSIKRRRRFFDRSGNFARAYGTFSPGKDKLTVETEINGFTSFFIFFYGIVLFAYGIFISVYFIFGPNGDQPAFIIPFILLHASIMFGLPYFIIRRSVTRMKYELERDLYFMTKK